MIDEPIAEIKEIRHQISQECHHDTNAYLAYLWQEEDQYREFALNSCEST